MARCAAACRYLQTPRSRSSNGWHLPIRLSSRTSREKRSERSSSSREGWFQLWCKRMAAVVLLALAGSGCGYALAGRGSFLPEYIQTIGIPPIENSTATSRIEQVLTEKIRTEFINRGKYRPVPTPAGAQ